MLSNCLYSLLLIKEEFLSLPKNLIIYYIINLFIPKITSLLNRFFRWTTIWKFKHVLHTIGSCYINTWNRPKVKCCFRSVTITATSEKECGIEKFRDINTNLRVWLILIHDINMYQGGGDITLTLYR